MTDVDTGERTYALGDSDSERRRLMQQSDLLGVYTRHVFEQAGIAPGMRVLDVGSGAGDVALLLADLVGPDGAVVGIDQNPAILATATARARDLGHRNITFVTGDVSDATFDRGFDAAVGRLVLMYLADPVAALRRIAGHLRPGGVVAFQEADFTSFAHSVPPIPLMADIHDWIRGAFAAAGCDTQIGFRVRRQFLDAGLPAPRLQFNTVMGGGEDFAGYTFTAATLRSLLPVIERAGLATAAEIDVDTLPDRLRDEVVAADASITTISVVGAWSTLPAAPAG